MVPELSIARVFRRELDALPLPPEDVWLPRGGRPHAPAMGIALVGGVALVLAVLLTIQGLRATPESTTVGDRAATPLAPSSGCAGSGPRCVTPLALSSGCAGSGPRCVTPLPNLYRSPAFGYNLIVPDLLRKVDDKAAAATGSGLLYRERFTARPADEDAIALLRYGAVPPWDFVVEVYDGAVVSAAERARVDGCGVGCVTTQSTTRGEPTLSATWTAGTLVLHGYYFDSNGRVFVLKYAVGPEETRPAFVNESDLLHIVETIGLV